MSSLKQLQPWLRPWAEQLLAASNGARVTSVYRRPALQRRLYRDFLRGRARYPVAPPGLSRHEHRRAFDLAAPPAELLRLGLLWESMGGRWGGRFGDPIHFEA